MASSTEKLPDETKETHQKTFTVPYKLKAGIFLASIAGFGFIAGFGSSLAATKKKDPDSFQRGVIGHKASDAELFESGARLASRALARGTLYAVGGCSMLFFCLWKLSGAKDLTDFRERAGKILPQIPKSNPPVGRTEFSGINDFLQYVIDLDKEEKELKMKTKK